MEAGLLIEEGVHAAYREDWERLDDGAEGTAAFAGIGGPSRLLVRVGSHFIRIEVRDPVSYEPGCVIDYGRVAAAGSGGSPCPPSRTAPAPTFGLQPDGEGRDRERTGLRWSPL